MHSDILQTLSSAGAYLPNDNICPRAKLDTGTFCNYRCYFCYYKNELDKKTSFEVIKKRIDTLYNIGCRDFDLSGGESSIHPDFFKILEYIKSLNPDNKIACLTNGSKFKNKDFLKKAKDSGLSEILFSLHSVNEIHDKMTGIKNSYNHIIKAIYNAKDLDIVVRLNSTITDVNYKLVDTEYFEVVEKIEPLEMNFLPLNYFSQNSNSSGMDYSKILEPIKRFIDLSKIPLINVRYVPFCYMIGYEKHVVGYYQHIYDVYDWNIAMYEYLEPNLTNLAVQAASNRKQCYRKSDACRNCKYFYICDGIEPQVLKTGCEFKPVQGSKIKDVNEFRKSFFDIKNIKTKGV